MCNDDSCVFRQILLEQYKRDITKEYVDRHNRLIRPEDRSMYPTESYLPKASIIEKMALKKLRYSVKFWGSWFKKYDKAS